MSFKSLILLLALALAGCGGSMSPLHVAVRSGDTAAVKSWIAAGKNLNPTYDEPTRGLEGNYARRLRVTPLMVAVVDGRLDMVKLLVEAGADLYAESDTQLPGWPRTAFDDAVDAGRLDIVRYLWERSDRRRFAARLDRHVAKSCYANCNAASGTDASTNLFLFLLSIASVQQQDAGIHSALCPLGPGSAQAQFVARYGKPLPNGVQPCGLSTPYR